MISAHSAKGSNCNFHLFEKPIVRQVLSAAWQRMVLPPLGVGNDIGRDLVGGGIHNASHNTVVQYIATRPILYLCGGVDGR